MRVRAEDVCLMMQHVFNAAIALLRESQPLSEELSLVQTAKLVALRRSLEDVVTLYKAYEEQEQKRLQA
jgi:hypothetical protein